MSKDVYSWDLNAPTVFDKTEMFSSGCVEKDFGGGLVVPVNGVAYRVRGATRSCYFYQSAPGMIPLYYCLVGSTVYVSQSSFSLRRTLSDFRVKLSAIKQCVEGVAYHFSRKGLRRFVVDKLQYNPQPNVTLEEAGTELLAAMTSAAKVLEGKKVITLVSGGTDGILSALAVREAGIDQLCICVGVSEDDFDPKYAKSYCEQLSLPYHFLKIEEEVLPDLLAETLTAIEASDFSNVLMGMCNIIIGKYMVENGFDTVVNADLADVVLGNDIFTWGSFNKHHENPTDAEWAEVRMKSGLKTLPTNLMIHKSFDYLGIAPVQLFANRNVLETILSFPMAITPPNGKKLVYYEILDRYLTGGSWNDKSKKVGYYTGSGIGKFHLGDGILSDANIRNVYSTINKG